MHPKQQAEIDSAPSSARGILERAYSGNSKAAALKAFCLRCVGYTRADVTTCTAYACPLHAYRPYQAGNETDEDAPDPQENALPAV